MCVFHLTIDHDSKNCPETARMMQLLSTNELGNMTPASETDSYQNGDSENLFLEYESDSETKGECYATIDGTSYIVLTRGQKKKGPSSSHPQRNDLGPSTSNTPADIEVSASHMGKGKSSFDFIQFCEDSKIQISAIDYLKTHPVEL